MITSRAALADNHRSVAAPALGSDGPPDSALDVDVLFAVRCGNSICEGSERTWSNAAGPLFVAWLVCITLAVVGSVLAVVRHRRGRVREPSPVDLHRSHSIRLIVGEMTSTGAWSPSFRTSRSPSVVDVRACLVA